MRQGPNWYSYCGSNPLTRYDPNGLWAKDDHGRITRLAAIMAGFTQQEIEWLGTGSRDCDAPAHCALVGPCRHFNVSEQSPGALDSRLGWLDREIQTAFELIERRDSLSAMWHVGMGLHSLQDIYAHGMIPSIVHLFLSGLDDRSVETPGQAPSPNGGLSSRFLAAIIKTYIVLKRLRPLLPTVEDPPPGGGGGPGGPLDAAW